MHTRWAEAASSIKFAVTVPPGTMKTLLVPAGITPSNAEVDAVAFHFRKIAFVIAVTSIPDVSTLSVIAVVLEIVESYVIASGFDVTAAERAPYEYAIKIIVCVLYYVPAMTVYPQGVSTRRLTLSLEPRCLIL